MVLTFMTSFTLSFTKTLLQECELKSIMSVLDLFPGSETGSEQSAVPVSLDSITAVSLLLVELISPDVMYNGLPWPEEEFCKVPLHM